MERLPDRARALRQQGLTYKEIQAALGEAVPKSTLSNWCRGIQLSRTHQARISAVKLENLVKARDAAVRSKAKQRQQQLETIRGHASSLLGTVSVRDAKIALAMLYLGEGYKFPVSRGLKLGSSDPYIIRLYIKLLQICFNISVNDLKCLISFRADQDLEALIEYWANVTGISPSNFYRNKPDPRTANKPTRNADYHGVATVSCKGVSRQLELESLARAVLGALPRV